MGSGFSTGRDGWARFHGVFTDTFAGIAPQSAAIFILTHLTAATLVTLTWHALAAFHRSQ